MTFNLSVGSFDSCLSCTLCRSWKWCYAHTQCCRDNALIAHYDDVIMTMLASQITSLTVVYSIVYSGVNQRKHQSSASLAFVREIHRGPVNFPHKWPVTRKMFPFDDVIMGKTHIVLFQCCKLMIWYFSPTTRRHVVSEIRVNFGSCNNCWAPSHYLPKCWHFSVEPLRTNLGEIWIKTKTLFQEETFENVVNERAVISFLQ